MNACQDQNSYELSRYMDEEDRLHKEWLKTVDDKIDHIISYAKKAINDELSVNEFNWIFSKYYDDDILWDKLDNILASYHSRSIDPLEVVLLKKVVSDALISACDMLYDEEFSDLVYNNRTNRSLEQIIEEVIK